MCSTMPEPPGASPVRAVRAATHGNPSVGEPVITRKPEDPVIPRTHETGSAPNQADSVEVIIVGAGPLGIELSVALTQAGVSHVLFDAGQLGNSITTWPRETPFFSTSERVAISGVPIQNTHQGRITGEDYLAYLRAVVEQFDLAPRLHEPVVQIDRDEVGFAITTHPVTGGSLRTTCRSLVLACGNMDRPHRVDVPGEDLPHVSHYFTDPHRYFQQRVLIVGGKNSAVEAALRCWRAGARVTLSYRRDTFHQRRVKAHLLPDLETQVKLGTIGYLPRTVPVSIEAGQVTLVGTEEDGMPSVAAGDPSEHRLVHPTDFVLLCTGFEADMGLFEQAGVTLEGPNRVPVFDPETMETDAPGVFVCGTAAAGTQSRYTLFIENTHVHVGRIVRHLTGAWPERLGTIAARDYEPPFSHIEAN